MPTLLSLNHITKKYEKNSSKIFNKKEYFTAVNDLNLKIDQGDIFGLIGESGSGKSTTAEMIMRIVDSTSGEILFKGKDISKLSRKEMIPYYSKMQMIFQDSGSSFNPRKTVGKQIITPMLRLGVTSSKKEAGEIVRDLFHKVGLKEDHLDRYPHQFSGGQRQRLGIARALALQPEFLVLDEPTSALDVSIQAQILNLLLDLQEEFKLTYLFISHNLDVVEFFCNKIAVMYKGKIVEIGDSKKLYKNPHHPVTEMLLNSVLSLDHKDSEVSVLSVNEDQKENYKGKLNDQSRCVFSDKCRYASEECFISSPSLINNDETYYACYHPLNKGEDSVEKSK
jgi:oligopeptide/dipeptide ABC transporter, ATP-binding protein, C-terminal domain